MLQATLRFYCRNPRCRQKLIEPTENIRQTFCCAGCHAGFYRSHCLVCESELPPGPINRRICRRTSCRAEIRRFPHLFVFAGLTTGKDTGNVQRPPKSSTKSKSFLRVWSRGPALSETSLRLGSLPLDPATATRVNRANRQAWEAACLIKPTTCRST